MHEDRSQKNTRPGCTQVFSSEAVFPGEVMRTLRELAAISPEILRSEAEQQEVVTVPPSPILLEALAVELCNIKVRTMDTGEADQQYIETGEFRFCINVAAKWLGLHIQLREQPCDSSEYIDTGKLDIFLEKEGQLISAIKGPGALLFPHLSPAAVYQFSVRKIR